MKDEGYAFVPLPPEVRRVPRAEAVHHQRTAGTITARVSLAVVTEQPVHVGSGFKALAGGQVVREMVRSGERLCVPGASLKGVLRSRFEAVTKSCGLLRVKDRPVGVRSTSFPGAKARFDEAVVRAPVNRPCSERETCPACGLFGRMSLRSRVAVGDLLPPDGTTASVEEVPEMFSPNLHHVGPFTPQRGDRGDLLVVHGLHGRKFGRGHGPEGVGRERVLAIPAGVTLTGELRVTNVTEAEFGGLLAAAGVLPESRLKLGAAKGHGLGRVRVERFAVAQHPGGAPLDGAFARYRAAFEASPDAWAKGLDALVAIHAAEAKP